MENEEIKSENQTEAAENRGSGGEERKKKSSYTKGQRIFAMIAVILLVGMYLATFVSALLASEATSALFRMCLASSILLPIMFWLYIRFWKMFTEPK